MFDAVIFDCDGVLVDSEILAVEAELLTLADFGLAYDLGDYKRRFLGLHHHGFLAALDEDFRARLGAPMPEGFSGALSDRYAALADRIEAIDGVVEAVAALGRKRAVASSSGTASLKKKVARAGLTDLFDPHVYSADLVDHGKPAPDIFLYAAGQLGADPARCLVVEDSVNGVIAGLAAGMTVWGFSGGAHMDEGAAERLIGAGAERILPGWADAARLWGGWDS